MFEISFRIAIFVAAFGGVIAILSFFAPTLPEEIPVAIAYFISAVGNWGYFLPLTSMSIILGSSLVFWTLLAIWANSNWFLVRFTR